MSWHPSRIGDAVRAEIGRFGPAGSMGTVVAHWPAAVGEAIAANAWPARVARDGTLHVATSSSVWAFELAQLEATIRERLRERVGPDAPRSLRFAPGRLPERGPEPGRTERSQPSAPSAEEWREAERIAAPIESEELRALIARAAAASLSRGSVSRA